MEDKLFSFPFLEQAVFYHVAAGRKSVVAQRGGGKVLFSLSSHFLLEDGKARCDTRPRALLLFLLLSLPFSIPLAFYCRRKNGNWRAMILVGDERGEIHKAPSSTVSFWLLCIKDFNFREKEMKNQKYFSWSHLKLSFPESNYRGGGLP